LTLPSQYYERSSQTNIEELDELNPKIYCWNIGVKMERNWKVGTLNTKLLNFDLMLCELKK